MRFLLVLLILLTACAPLQPAPSPKALKPRFIFPEVHVNNSPAPWRQFPPARKAGAGVPMMDAATWGNLRAIGVAATMDWGAFVQNGERAAQAGMLHHPMQWGCRPGAVKVATLQAYASRFQGSLWLMFNEPDLAEQANCTPEQGVDAWVAATTAIRAVDPAARFACCGESYGRWAWTARFLDVYRERYGKAPELAAVQMHVYQSFRAGNYWDWNLWAKRFDWEATLKPVYLTWYDWYRTRPELARLPVIVSETGVLTADWHDVAIMKGCPGKYKTEAERMARCTLDGWMRWITARPEVVEVLWFSSNMPPGVFVPSNLCVEKDCAQLTVLGAAWRENVVRWQ